MTQGFYLALLLLLPVGGLTSFQVEASPADEYASAGNFEPHNPDAIWHDINEGLSASNSDSVFLPTADIGPMPLAILAVESVEAPLERVRYRLRYGVDMVAGTPGGASAPFSYIEVVRFNLGPAIRDELMESLGAEHVADEDAFGVGPHVAWRFVTQPLMGNRAIGVTAGRSEVSQSEAEASDCLGVSCLATYLDIDALVPWAEMEQVDAPPPAAYLVSVDGVVTPVAAIDMLLGEVTGLEAESNNSAPAIPDHAIEAVIDVNLGQDRGLELVYRWGGLLDDSVGAIWHRLASVSAGGSEPMVFEAQAYECRRGPEFAPPGDFCP